MDRPTLTRRDALAALAAGSAGVAGIAALKRDDLTTGELDEHDRRTLVAVAETVYPSAVDGIEPFVETYVAGRVDDDPDHAEGIVTAVERLDEYVGHWYDRQFVDLSADDRDDVLREMGVDVADSGPDGGDAERVRYYLVNDLLYALFTSPTGGELVGLENPQGYPGGTDSYRRPP
ncbi:MAG: gluconate 2-dehydrogenase subunit 3 family protein [Haloarculaceae archaeon]